MAEDSTTQEPVPVKGSLSVVGRNISVLPDKFSRKYGTAIHTLDLSHNKLSSLDNISGFSRLKSLILDNNELTDACEFPDLPTVDTLSLNSNNITDLKVLLDKLHHAVPNLRYLALLKNPCCPHRLIGKDDDEYDRYRLYVIWRLPNLTFLDSGRVTPEERAEAVRRGQFCLPQKPTEIVSTQTAIEASIGATDDLTESVPESSTHFGVCRYYYQGKQSEGNRFIKNGML